jgi:hypothetical protein
MLLSEAEAFDAQSHNDLNKSGVSGTSDGRPMTDFTPTDGPAGSPHMYLVCDAESPAPQLDFALGWAVGLITRKPLYVIIS